MSILDIETTRKNNELQKAIVAFGVHRGGIVLWCSGKGVECEIEQVSADADEIGITDNESPDEGIWVWEGYFRYWQDYEGEWDCTVDTHQWREPTDEEWGRIRRSANPFLTYCPKCNAETEGNQCPNCKFFLS